MDVTRILGPRRPVITRTMSFIARPVRAIFVSVNQLNPTDMNYDHYQYGLQLATHLKAIDHSESNPRYFKAYGLEDLYNFDDKLSCVKGHVLIAVDGYESNSSDNHGDGLTDARHYSFIVACSTVSDRTQTIDEAFESSRLILKQIRNRLILDPNLMGFINRDTEITGIGPIGDNFYGCILTFTIDEPESFKLDASYWKE